MAELIGDLRDLLPAGDDGTKWARFLASTIQRVHHMKPDKWGLTPLPKLLRLNFGMIEVVTMSPEEAIVIVDYRALREPDNLIDAGILYTDEESPEIGVFRSVPGAAACIVWDADYGERLDDRADRCRARRTTHC